MRRESDCGRLAWNLAMLALGDRRNNACLDSVDCPTILPHCCYETHVAFLLLHLLHKTAAVMTEACVNQSGMEDRQLQSNINSPKNIKSLQGSVVA
jgi:hypothetical protein